MYVPKARLQLLCGAMLVGSGGKEHHCGAAMGFGSTLLRNGWLDCLEATNKSLVESNHCHGEVKAVLMGLLQLVALQQILYACVCTYCLLAGLKSVPKQSYMLHLVG